MLVLTRMATMASRRACGPTAFPRDDVQRLVVEHCLSEQLLEPGILGFQIPQAFGIGHVHAAELATPQVEGGIA